MFNKNYKHKQNEMSTQERLITAPKIILLSPGIWFLMLLMKVMFYQDQKRGDYISFNCNK